MPVAFDHCVTFGVVLAILLADIRSARMERARQPARTGKVPFPPSCGGRCDAKTVRNQLSALRVSSSGGHCAQSILVLPVLRWRRRQPNLLPARGRPHESRWELRMHEAMYRYQLRFGWRPIGPHRALGDALFDAIAVSCPGARAMGCSTERWGSSYSICPSCFGFGSRPLPGAPELEAIRRRVGEAFPEA